jgi:hypothetical protein
MAENRGVAAGRPEKVEEDADGCGFPRTIQSEEAKDLTGINLQMEIVYRGEGSIALGQAGDRDGCRGTAVGIHAPGLMRSSAGCKQRCIGGPTATLAILALTGSEEHGHIPGRSLPRAPREVPTFSRFSARISR